LRTQLPRKKSLSLVPSFQYIERKMRQLRLESPNNNSNLRQTNARNKWNRSIIQNSATSPTKPAQKRGLFCTKNRQISNRMPSSDCTVSPLNGSTYYEPNHAQISSWNPSTGETRHEKLTSKRRQNTRYITLKMRWNKMMIDQKLDQRAKLTSLVCPLKLLEWIKITYALYGSAFLIIAPQKNSKIYFLPSYDRQNVFSNHLKRPNHGQCIWNV